MTHTWGTVLRHSGINMKSVLLFICLRLKTGKARRYWPRTPDEWETSGVRLSLPLQTIQSINSKSTNLRIVISWLHHHVWLWIDFGIRGGIIMILRERDQETVACFTATLLTILEVENLGKRRKYSIDTPYPS